MPAKIPRLTIYPPEDIFLMIKKDSDANERSQSSQVIWVLRQYYQAKVKEAEIFTPTELNEEEPGPVPVYRMKDAPGESVRTKNRERPSLENNL
jgi:hypothetical protein